MADVASRTRVMTLKDEIRSGGFGPVPGEDIPGYVVKRLISRDLSSHMINIVSVEPGSGKFKHAHAGADTVFVFLEGKGEYLLDEEKSRSVKAGDIAIAVAGQIHGTQNTADRPLRYLCVEGPLPKEGLALAEPGAMPPVSDELATMRRVWTLKEEIDKGGFVPWDTETLPGYAIKRFLSRHLCRHMIQLAQIEPGHKKVHTHEAENVLVFLEGEAEYFSEWDKTQPVKPGDICIAMANEVHGFRNTGTEMINFLAIEGPLPLIDASAKHAGSHMS